MLGRFSAGGLEGWQVRHFEGETRYRIVEDGGTKVLEALSEAGASSLYLEREIDLAARPVLEWRWRVEAPLGVPDERVRAGDDFAARVYVVAPGEGLFALPVAISYVWSASAAGRRRLAEPVHGEGADGGGRVRLRPMLANGAATGAICGRTSAACSAARWTSWKAWP